MWYCFKQLFAGAYFLSPSALTPASSGKEEMTGNGKNVGRIQKIIQSMLWNLLLRNLLQTVAFVWCAPICVFCVY